MLGRVANILRAAPLRATYATKVATTVEAPSGLKAVQGIMSDVANSQPTPAQTQVFDLKVREIKPSRVVRPIDLSYDQRVSKYNRRRPSQVAPTSREARSRDVFHQLDLDPLSLATYPLIMSHFVTEMGLIKPRTQTGLTVKSQRRLGKAIRRARMMGVIPILSRLPEAQFKLR
ncbi:hypothetical protein BKA70DRAFT_1396328 [Coprinopsis sp. MPI-PUGE-AT-0042]|nr:hypothetical protein BKA70DRAFT_1396328 [Coprinopsis sp. MPI-PUGE-AT-0042]